MPTQTPQTQTEHRSPLTAEDVLDAQVIRLKRGRFNQFGFEPLWNAYYDFYLSTKYFAKPLLQFEDVTFHLFLRKNLNDNDPGWRMPSLRYIKRQFGMGQDKIEKILERLTQAKLLTKVSGKGRGKKGANVTNEYVLSDPIQAQEEFLLVAQSGAFEQSLLDKWQRIFDDVSSKNGSETPVPVSGTAPSPETGTAPSPETGTHKHTSKKHTSQQQTVVEGTHSQNGSLAPPADPPSDVVVALMGKGISLKVAKNLAAQYNRERISEKIEFLEYLKEHHPQKVKSPGGWLRKAIEDDFSKPDGFKTTAELDAENLQKERRNAEVEAELQRLDLESKAKEELRRTLEQQRFEAWKRQYGTTQSDLDVWEHVLEELGENTPSATFMMLLSKTVLLTVRDKNAVIGVPSGFGIGWLESQMKRKIRLTLKAYRSDVNTIEFVDLSKEPPDSDNEQLDDSGQPITLQSVVFGP